MNCASRRVFLKLVFLNMFLLQLFNPIKPLLGSLIGKNRKEDAMILPRPNEEGRVSVEKAIKNRRTVRSFTSRQLTKDQFSQLLFAAQGITEDRGFKRAAPSGGALYPIDVYAVVGEKGVEDLDAGIYHYVPPGHRVELVGPGDKRKQIANASLWQMWMAQAPVNLVITAEYARICSKYGDRGIRYAIIEAGHVGQNIFLQAEALGLRAGIVGAFNDAEIIKIMGIPKNHEPLLIMPVGYQA